MPAESQPQMRRFGDYTATRQAVFDNALTSVQSLPPFENSRYSLSLGNVGYLGPTDFSTQDHHNALVEGRTLARRMVGTYTLTDKASGSIVDKKRTTVAAVPWLSNHGTFVMDGNQQILSHQFRLMPGVFARQKANGSLESHANFLPGKGVPHRLNLDPETGVFKVTAGQAEIPAINLLRAVGATDDEIKGAWGPQLLAVNRRHEKPHYLDRLYDKFGPQGKRPDGLDVRQALADRISKYELDPWVAKRTLGQPFKNYGKEAMLAATKKLLDISHGRAEPDDRDNPAYSTVWGPEHLVAERLSRVGPVMSKVLWQVTNAGSLKNLPTGLLSPSVRSVFTKSGLGLGPEGTSSSEFVDHGARITKVGEGGIGRSADSIPDAARYVSANHIPFIDLVRTSESESVGVDLRTAFGTRLGHDNRLYAPFRDAKSGKLVFKSPQDVADATIAFPDAHHSQDPVVPVIRAGKMTYAPKNEIDYVVPSMEQSFSPMTNMVPLKSAMKAQRSSMGARFITQSLPLVKSESPLVRSEVPGQAGKSFEELFGRHMGAVTSRPNAPGVVQSVTPNEMTVRYQDGSVDRHQLYNNLPSGRFTGFHHTPLVKEGDVVAPNQVLAKSNYTDHNGHAAYGANLRVAFAAMPGVYEDAVAVSQSAARKLTSDHLYRHEVEAEDGVHLGKHSHAAAFPGKYSLDTLKTMGDDGVVLPGTIVKKNDPLILSVRKRSGQHGRLSRSGRSEFSDASEVWENDEPGEVVGVHNTKNGPVVFVKAAIPAKIGDKLTNRHGSKGVTQIIPDHEMPVDSQGRPLEMIISSLGIVSRANPSALFEAHLGKIAEKTGKPYVVPDFQPGQDMGRWVEEEGRKHGVPFLETLTDPKTGREIPNVAAGNSYILKLSHMACYDPETEVLTGRGWVRWEDVTDSDLLATLNSDDRLVYEKPLELIRTHYDGLLYCFGGRYVDYAVTDNHRMYTWTGQSAGRYQFRRADAMHGRKHYVRQFGFVPDDANRETHYKIAGRDFVWDDYAELVGWWAAEGYVNKLTQTVIYQHQHANPDKFARLEALVNRLPVSWGYYRAEGKLCGVVLYDKDLGRHFKTFGSLSYNKRLPRHLMTAPLSSRTKAFEAMMLGDGTRGERNGPYAKYGTASCGLAADFQELCVGLGFGAIVREVTCPSHSTRRKMWVCGVALSRKHALLDTRTNPNAYFTRNYSGPVYCATMSTGLLYVRRNGKPMLCGNSKKVKGRGLGGYDETGQPLRGQSGGAMRSSMGDTNALLSYGATNVIYDDHMMKGQSNPDFWLQYLSGFPPPRPNESAPFNRFLTELRAGGVDPVRKDSRYHLKAMTDEAIDKLAGDREVKNGETLDFSRNGEAYKGGLFDSATFGGSDSQQWAKIKLHEPILNPVFEEPARRLLGLTEQKFRDVIAGKESLPTGTGMKGVAEALKSVDVKKELAKARQALQGTRKTARDEAVRKIGYLKHLDASGRTPADWVVSSVPVLPPVYRPVSVGRGGVIVSDQNMVYKDLIDANHAYRELSGEVGDAGAERLNLYDAAKAAFGLGSPVNVKNQERGVKGVLERLLGSTSKMSYMQQKLLGTPVNLSGRGQVLPSADLDMDEVGLPEKMAWDIFHPFVVRNLVRGGVPRVEAARHVQDRNDMARRALLDEMEKRPVRMTRYPALHRYSTLGQRAKLVKGDAILTNYYVNKGLNMDHDGDDQHATVIVSMDKATQDRLTSPEDPNFWEVRKMSARFRAFLPIHTEDGVFCVHLEEFPRGEFLRNNEHRDFYAVPAGVKVVAYDEKKGQPVLADVAQWSVHRDREVEIVNLLSGRQIVTDDDPRAVYGVDPHTLEFKRARPKDAVGMMVPRVDRFHDPDSIVESATLYDGTDPIPVKLSPSFGYVCGLMAGNGWISGDGGQARQVCLATSDHGVEAAYREAYGNVFGGAPHVTVAERDAASAGDFGASRRLVISDTSRARMLRPLFGDGARAKHLPPFFLSGDESFRKSLLAGLVDTDGSVAFSSAKDKLQLLVNYTSASLRMIQEIQHLCRSVGILSTITASKTPAGLSFWLLNISTPDFQAAGIPLKHSGKFSKLAKAEPAERKSGGYNRNHMIPMPPKLAEAMRRAISAKVIPDKAARQVKYSALTAAIRIARVPRSAVADLIDRVPQTQFGDVWSRFVSLVGDESTVWDTVTDYEVTGVKETGHDLSVPGYETFMSADGVILSNTTTISVPLSDEAVKEVYEKLLPSKNLFTPASMRATSYIPNMEQIAGLHHASTADEGNAPVVFRTRAEAIAAYRSGKINAGTRVRIAED